ncbi:MAG: DNA-binding protein [archaeon]
MGDTELEEIRRQRMAQLQRQKEHESTQQLLQQLRRGAQLFITREAADRLDRVRYAHPQKAVLAEQSIVEMAKRRQISRENPLTEEQLIVILQSFGAERETTTERR